MTECNPSPILFSSLGRRSVEAYFDGGSLTSDAGALLLREADRRLGLTAALNQVIPDPRNQDLIVHEQLTMLRQRIYAIALGNEDLNDHQELRQDPLMQVATERGIRMIQNEQTHQKEPVPLASPPTLCRLENRIGRRALVDMAKVLVEKFIAAHATPPAELILDFDATDDPVHGNQVGASSTAITMSMLPAAVRVLRGSTAGGVSASSRHRCFPPRLGDPLAAGGALPRGLARCKDHLPR